MKHFKCILVCLIVLFAHSVLKSQPDYTSETKLNQSSKRHVSGDENKYSVFNEPSKIPQSLLDAYGRATDNYDDAEKLRLSKEMEKYLVKTQSRLIDPSEYSVSFEENPMGDWYNSDIEVHTGDINTSSFRTMDLKQAEDTRMYLGFARRNLAGNNGALKICISSNGGVSWPSAIFWNYPSIYIHSMSMLVERRDNNNDDSTRIFIYFVGSTSSNFDNASLYLFSCRRNATGVYSLQVATPGAGNRFIYPSACSDGMFYSSGTFMHVAVREETNTGVPVRTHHFRTTDWGETHTSSTFNTGFDDRYTSIDFSNETGTDSVYIAVERRISNDEWEIRLITSSEIPSPGFSVGYITDAVSGTMYEKPSISIQQRHFSLPQQILVTSTKNDRAVYHASTNGGTSWNVDASLGLVNQQVDYTSCNSDSLTAGGGYFIASYVDIDGDSVTVRRGILGAMGNVQHKKNSNPGTSVLAPSCAIYKSGSDKYSAFTYAGNGPANVYYNMESLVTGIQTIGNNTPEYFTLSQNYPNPFNPVTNIEFALPKSSFVKLVIYDMLGREAATLVNQNLIAGSYRTDWDASGYPSGVYFYKLETDRFADTKKMIIIK